MLTFLLLLRKTIESSAGVIVFPRFKVITYKKQIVAGTKYILKVSIYLTKSDILISF
jgi:hypothetical protein